MTKKSAKIRAFEGSPVVDADAAMMLQITPNDVKGASKKNPATCAAARAGQRELGKDVRVFLTRTYVKEKNHWIRFKTPESVSREIISFDRGSAFDPGEYHFVPLSPSQRLGGYRGPSTPKTGKHKPRPHHATGHVRERGKYDSTHATLVKKKVARS